MELCWDMFYVDLALNFCLWLVYGIYSRSMSCLDRILREGQHVTSCHYFARALAVSFGKVQSVFPRRARIHRRDTQGSWYLSRGKISHQLLSVYDPMNNRILMNSYISRYHYYSGSILMNSR